MPIQMGKDNLYTQEEVLKEVNRELGRDPLSKEMFAYLRDIRKILPKPIRLKIKPGRGGAHSYYTEDTIRTLKEIMRHNKKMGQTITEISATMQPVIERMMRNAEMMRPVIDQCYRSMKNFADGLAAQAAPVIKALESADWGKIGRKAISEEIALIQKAIDTNASDAELESRLNELFSLREKWKDLKDKKTKAGDQPQKKGE